MRASNGPSRETRGEERESWLEENLAAAAPVLEALREVGLDLDSLHRLHTREWRKRRYREAIPVLLHWLPRVERLSTKEGIIMALGVPWAGRGVSRALLEEYERAAARSDGFLIQREVANSLASCATDEDLEAVLRLIDDPHADPYARNWLLESLGRMKDPRAPDRLVAILRAEPEFAPWALSALRKVGRPGDLPSIEPYLFHEQAWIRKEAAKARERILKRAGGGTSAT